MKPTRHISMMEQCSMKYTATDKTAKEKTKSKNIKTRVIPGYHLSLGIVVTMLSVIVLIPLASVLVYSLKISPGDFVALIMKENVRNAFITSITSSFIAAIVNVVFGLIVAWTLVKYDFPGKWLLDGLIELPFALPTAVAGITLSKLYSGTGFFGKGLGKLVIAILHDMDFVAENFERVIIMAHGQVLADGTARDVFMQDEALKKARLQKPYMMQLGEVLGYERAYLTVDEILRNQVS